MLNFSNKFVQKVGAFNRDCTVILLRLYVIKDSFKATYSKNLTILNITGTQTVLLKKI